MRAEQFQTRLDVFITTLGTPHFQHFYPITPVPRHAGTPRYVSEKKAREGDPEAKRWVRGRDFRRDVKMMTNNVYKDPPLRGALFAFMEFFVLRPKKHSRTDPPVMVTTRPDAKNYMWAMEDALNPRRETIKGVGKRMVTWPGLWEDDSQVTTFPIRRWADHPSQVGIRVSVWKIDNEAAS